MNVKHFEKGFQYTDRQLLTVARKVGKIATYCNRVKDESSVIKIYAERRKTEKRRDQIKVTITIDLPKKTLRAESRRPDVIEAVDRCIEKLDPQLKKYKDLLYQKGRTARARKHSKR